MEIISRKEKARFNSPYFFLQKKGQDLVETIDGNFFIIFSFLQPAA